MRTQPVPDFMEIEDYKRELRRQQKWMNYNFAIAVVAVLVLLAVNYYYSNQLGNLQDSYNTLYSRYSYQNTQVSQLQQQMENMMQSYDQKSFVYSPPTANTSMVIWTKQQTVTAGSSIEWDLLDTFVNRISITSNASAEYMIMDLPNYARFYQNAPYVPLVDNITSHFQATERLSQGCAVYVLVIVNHTSHPILLTPDVTATYAPSAFLTGQCSLTP